MRFDANGILKWDAAPPAGSLMEYLSSLVAHWELRRPSLTIVVTSRFPGCN